MFLTKINSISERSRRIFAADFETTNVDNQHIVTTACLVSDNISWVESVKSTKNLLLESQNVLEKFINTCFQVVHNNNIYFHNLSKFDGILS